MGHTSGRAQDGHFEVGKHAERVGAAATPTVPMTEGLRHPNATGRARSNRPQHIEHVSFHLFQVKGCAELFFGNAIRSVRSQQLESERS